MKARAASLWTPAFLMTGLLAAHAVIGCSGPDTQESNTGGATTDSGGAGGSTTSQTGTDPGGGTTGGAGTGGLGGSGGDTTTGGTGGLGGGGAGGGSGGGVVMGGDPGPACAAICNLGTCNGNVCTEEPRLAVSIGASRSEFLDQPPTEQGLASACYIEKSVTQVDVLATAGPCWLIKLTVLEGGFSGLPFDAGAITIDGPTSGSVPLSAAGNCQSATVPFESVFTAGDEVTATATGGATHPAFSLAVTAPEDLVFTTTPLDSALPFTASWSPSPPPEWIMLVSAQSTLFCLPPDPDSLTVPAAMMSLFLAGADHVSMMAGRSNMTHTDFGGAGPDVYWAAGRSVTKTVKYMP